MSRFGHFVYNFLISDKFLASVSRFTYWFLEAVKFLSVFFLIKFLANISQTFGSEVVSKFLILSYFRESFPSRVVDGCSGVQPCVLVRLEMI